MKTLSLSIFATLLFITAFCKPLPVKMKDVAVPSGFQKLSEAKGDLDKDGIAELVVVFNTPKKGEFGTERQLWIYKQKGADWKVWHKSIGPVLSSKHGGMMGDPFVSVKIIHGCIEVYHFGGDAEKWQYTHLYRYQHNNWYLIGVTIINSSCSKVENYDYNLSTGKIYVSIDKGNCIDDNKKNINANDENFTLIRKPESPLLMDGFNTGDNEVKLPGEHDSFYF